MLNSLLYKDVDLNSVYHYINYDLGIFSCIMYFDGIPITIAVDDNLVSDKELFSQPRNIVNNEEQRK